ncbi:MAG: arsenate reductase [Uliginosibacterium sp.]|nr:arsenate reductase [Uliginosibacterium sp.]
MAMTTIYGIKNCDTMRKAFSWFDARRQSYTFIDFKKSPPSRQLLEEWLGRASWQQLINSKGTTWRKLPESDKLGLNSESACQLMLAHPSLIKRPILESGKAFVIGFDQAAYLSIFGDEDA